MMNRNSFSFTGKDNKFVKDTKLPPISEFEKCEPDIVHKQEKYAPDGYWDGETIDDEK